VTGRLPDFLIVGAMRSGTTSLARSLERHPDVFLPPTKEVHFFDRNFDKGLSWYAAHFRSASGYAVVGEATPEYMYDEEARRRMSATLPEARLIAILRDPTDRAYSHYWHERNLGRESLSFEQALEAEERRLQDEDPVTRCRFAYAERGFYLHQLRALEETHGRSAMNVVLFEDFVSDPHTEFRRVASFLGVSDHVPDAVERNWNPTKLVRSQGARRLARKLPKGPLRRLGLHMTVTGDSYPPMPSALRAALCERFRESNRDLGTWLGRELPWG